MTVQAIRFFKLVRPTRLVKRSKYPKREPSEVTQLKRLRRIRSFIQKSTRGSVKKPFFLNCLRASLSKSFEFCLEAHAGRNRIAFFLVPSLRSICEDLIVLSYMGKMSSVDRNKLGFLLMRREL